MSDDLKLENQLCFPLYALSRQVTTIYRPHLEKLGLTYPQYLVMMVLWEHRSVTVKLLGELLCLDSGTLTPLLKRMEANKLLVRKRSAGDERMVDITITDEGLMLETKAESIPPNIKAGLDMTDEQIAKLRKQLREILTKTINDNK